MGRRQINMRPPPAGSGSDTSYDSEYEGAVCDGVMAAGLLLDPEWRSSGAQMLEMAQGASEQRLLGQDVFDWMVDQAPGA